MKDKSKITYFLAVMIFSSCAHYSTTQQNIKKVNAALEVKKKNTPVAGEVTPKSTQNLIPDHPGAMPLAKYLDSKTVDTSQSANPWFSILQDWSKVYLDIAKSEQDIRNYKLSAKYSQNSLMWAHRALQIKDLPTSGALYKVNFWMDQLEFPALPQTFEYFAAQEVYAKILITQDKLKNFENRACLISRGAPIIQTLAYLDLSIELYKQKKYAKALYKIQNAHASIENIHPNEDKKCSFDRSQESDVEEDSESKE